MRIVIDMQGAQTGSRFRGIGRYTVSLSKALVQNRGSHEIILVFSGLFPETIEPLAAEFEGLLPKECFRIWYACGPTEELNADNLYRRQIAEKIREAFLLELHPDIVLITSLFEGLGDNAIVSVGHFYRDLPTAVILYDLIPLINPDQHFKTSRVHQTWYASRIESLKRSQLLLAISESARQEALSTLDFAPDTVVNVSGACSDYFSVSEEARKAQGKVWHDLGISRPFIMYTGGADERKNLHRLIMAYAALPMRLRKKHQLVFAGKMPDDYVRNYLDVAKNNGLSHDELIVTGYVDDPDLLTLYNTCTLFVFPSTHEGFGLPPLEAMACGAPVIGANATSLPEVIGLEEALFDPYSVPSISEKICQVLCDEQFRSRLVKHSMEHYKNFSWDESAQRALRELEKYAPFDEQFISHRLTVEQTSIFTHRHLKILVVKLDHLGDFLLAIPAITKLKSRYPYADIDIVVGSWNAPLAKQLNIFNRVYTYDYFKKKSSESPSVSAHKLEELLATLNCYDIALDLRRQPDTRFLLVKVLANLKVGYQTFDREVDDLLDISLKAYRDTAFIATPMNHTYISRQMLAIVDAIPADSNDYIVLPDIVPTGSQERGSIAVFPKAGMETREWLPANFVKLVNQLAESDKVSNVTIYFANQQEAAAFDFVFSAKVTVCNGLDIVQLAESLAKKELCIANNSGGAHLAAYLGVMTLGIYSGHELPSEWGPQFNDAYVIHRVASCSPCHGATLSECPHDRFCIEEVSVTDVYAAAMRLLGRYTSSAGQNGMVDVIKRALPKNTDSIVSELITSISAEAKHLNSTELIELADAISKNHPAYPLSPDLTCIIPNCYVDHASNLIIWNGFSGAESDFRWTDGYTAEICFNYPDNQPSVGIVILHFGTLGRQRIIIKLNDLVIHDEVKNGSDIELTIPVTNIEAGPNSLSLLLPDARVPGNGDGRKLGLAFKQIKIKVDTGEAE